MPHMLRILFSCLTLFALGCSSEPPTAPVKGKVTLDGQPVYPARVMFTPVAGEDTTDAGKVSSALTEVDGSYTIAAAGVGPNTVGVIMLPVDADSEEAEDEEMPPPAGKPEKPTYEVTDGENVIDITLKPVETKPGTKKGPRGGDDD